ncbi:MAG: hypothetical protein FWE63_06415 [Bacteroidales bacterium]|nr:hypothetical protein [Bacteroidales bacterium]
MKKYNQPTTKRDNLHFLLSTAKNAIVKYSINGILLLGILSIPLKSTAQSDNYTWSLKFGGSPFSNIINHEKTYNWYGNSTGPEILLVGLGYKNYILSTSFRYFENTTKKDLPYRNTNYYLPGRSNVRMVFWNVSLSYEKEIIRRIFVEPNVGFLKNFITSNIVDFEGNEFEIKDLSGLTVGVNLIKYIKFIDGFFLGLYISGNYNFIGYRKLSSDLINNTFGYSIGAVFKFTDVKKKEQLKWI